MSGRRQKSRYFVPGSHGVLRVMRDVVVRRMKRGEMVAVSDEPAKPGEWLTVECVDEAGVSNRMRVAKCHPFLQGASVRYRLLLELPGGNQELERR